MSQLPVQIIIIDDDLEMESRPLYVKLSEKYGKEHITWKDNPETGISYVKKHLTQRTIIILDYHFGTKGATGLSLFRKLQKESSLLYIILNTAKVVDEIPNSELKIFINDHLMALVDKTDGYNATIDQVEKAINYLDNRVDCILEAWIIRHEKFKKEKPFIKIDNDKSLSMQEVLHEIRKDTPLGKKMTSNIISIAITLLQKDINKIDKKK